MGRKFEILDFGIDIHDKHFNFAIEYSKDFNARRAAAVCGYAPDSGYSISEREDVRAVLSVIASKRLEASHIDAEWVLMEAVDNHMIARQNDNITASNTALNLIAKHTMVDALASDKLNLNVQGDQEIRDRLMRARKRVQAPESAHKPVPSASASNEAEMSTSIDSTPSTPTYDDDTVSFF
jgi:hypothetical protein